MCVWGGYPSLLLHQPLPYTFRSQAKAYALRLENPCWPQGFKRSFPMESIYGSPCASVEKPLNYFPKALVNMSGSGDPAQCLALAESLFRFTDCSYSSCSFDGVFQPPVEGNFIVSFAESWAGDGWGVLGQPLELKR